MHIIQTRQLVLCFYFLFIDSILIRLHKQTNTTFIIIIITILVKETVFFAPARFARSSQKQLSVFIFFLLNYISFTLSAMYSNSFTASSTSLPRMVKSRHADTQRFPSLHVQTPLIFLNATIVRTYYTKIVSLLLFSKPSKLLQTTTSDVHNLCALYSCIYNMANG